MNGFLRLVQFVAICSLAVRGETERRKIVGTNVGPNAEKVGPDVALSSPAKDYGNPHATDGPWPECVGQTGDWCMDYVSEWIGYMASTSKLAIRFQTVDILPNYEYNPSRVWIHVDDRDKVLSAPEIG